MAWLHPVMLAGLAGGVIPLIIHLIQRQRAPEHEFPAVKLLVAARKRLANRLRLRQLLVMMLRVLCLLFFALGLAMPLLKAEDQFVLGEGPASMAIVFDDTLSMRYAEDSQSCFKKAQQETIKYLEQLRGFDRVRAVSFTGRPIGPGRFSADVERLIQGIKDTEPSFTADPARPALETALSALKKEKSPRKLLVIISDMTRSSWNSRDLEMLASAPVDVRMVKIRRNDNASNRHIEDLDVKSADGIVSVVVKIKCSGKLKTKSFTCSIELEDGSRSQVTVTPDREGRGLARLTGATQEKRYYGQVRLPEDNLPADNTWYLAGVGYRKIRTLIVNGDPHESMYASETFYLDSALRAGGQELQLKPRTVTHEEVREISLADFDCIVFANCPAKSLPPRGQLKRYVDAGGALWFILGDRVKSSSYRKHIGNLLPAVPLRINGGQAQNKKHATVRVQNARHPLFRSFSKTWVRKFGRAKFRKYWSLEARETANILLQFDTGEPALVETEGQSSRVFLLASPLDRDWNNFCIQPVFVPFIYESIRYLGGGMTDDQPVSVKVGRTLQHTLRFEKGTIFVKAPGKDADWRTVMVRERKARFEKTNRPGIYKISSEPGAQRQAWAFAVNPDPEASKLQQLPTGDFEQERQRQLLNYSRSSGQGQGTSLWQTFFWIVLGLLFVESVLCQK